MSIGTRIFLGILMVIVVGFSFFLWWLVDDLEPEYRKATEEPLIDSARILASTAASTAQGNRINAEIFKRTFDDFSSRRQLYAKIFDHVKKESDIRVYLTDASGIVLFDSFDPENIGKDFSHWLDVYKTLRGEYGARTTRDVPGNPTSSVMYVAAPVIVNDKIAGVLSVGKPTITARLFTERAKRKISAAAAGVIGSMLLVAILLSGMITRPLRKLSAYARSVRDGKKVSLPPFGSGEVAELGTAFEEMRDALEGKHSIERYVQTLTHEIKGPLSAISGAVELLREELPPEQQRRFLENIGTESERIESIADKLLLLSSLESRKTLVESEMIDMGEIVRDLLQSLFPLIKSKHIQMEADGAAACVFSGDAFLVQHAVSNVLRNAIDFSPSGGTIRVHTVKTSDHISLAIEDSGPGIPEYARIKVYDRFYSLKRPDSGRKSSGLGLSLVKEIMELHHGKVEIGATPDGGARVILRFPVVPV
ncbi:MAG: two-component system sensor histidine kinase CreC [Nitrospirae bacterium]|nr:two-component system sensor histidine kinase CreC [Nitrospirota bacterium]